MRKIKDVKAYKRLEAVAFRGEGKNNKEISKLTGFHPDVVGRLTKEYLQHGEEYLIEDDRKGGNSSNLSEVDRENFLSQFKEAAEKGELITVEGIAKEYDKLVKKEHKSKSTVYYLLHKSGWRKVMPRSKHPKKASDEEIESSKKLTIGLRN